MQTNSTKSILTTDNEPVRQWIGGSEVAAIFGQNPYCSPFKLWQQIFGIERVAETARMTEGKAMEPIIADLYAAKFGVQIEVVEPRRHPKFTFLGGSPDRVRDDRRVVLEIKTAGYRQVARWGEEGTDDIPAEYLIQGQYYAGLENDNGGNVDRIDYALWVMGEGEKYYSAQFNPALYAQLVLGTVEYFNAYVQTKQSPPPDGSEAAERAIRDRWPSEIKPETTIVADGGTEATIAELRKAYEDSWVLEDITPQLKQQLMAYMGDAAYMESSLGRFSWKQNKDSEKDITDWDAVRAAYAHDPAFVALVAQHTKKIITPGARVFRTPWRKPKA